jgi:hypothetical protein
MSQRTDKTVILAAIPHFKLSGTQQREVAHMKISFRDRIQAIKNSKVYQKDYQLYVKKREQARDYDEKIGPPWDPRNHLSTAGKRLCLKWGLLFPVHPDAPLEPFRDIKMPSTDLEAWMIDGAAYPVSFPTEDELENPSHKAENYGQKVITHLNGKLCLLVDTSWPPDMIMDVLWKFINHYVKENKGRINSTEEDPWKIYEMYQKTKNLLEVTRELYGISELPAYDYEADKYYKRVKRAYLKALKMIDYVEKEAKKQKRLPK